MRKVKCGNATVHDLAIKFRLHSDLSFLTLLTDLERLNGENCTMPKEFYPTNEKPSQKIRSIELS